MQIGTITQIVSVVVDIHFPSDIPEIYHALEVDLGDGKKLILEVN